MITAEAWEILTDTREFTVGTPMEARAALVAAEEPVDPVRVRCSRCPAVYTGHDVDDTVGRAAEHFAQEHTP